MRSPKRSGEGRSYAWIRSNILGLVAIFIALSGTAVAAQVASTDGGSATKAAKKKKKKAGKPGPPGPQGPAGPAGTAVAFAHVNADGTLDAGRSKNISGSFEQSAVDGYYCVTPSVPVTHMVATADVPSVRVTAAASFEDPFTSCPANAVVVTTFNSAGNMASNPFWVMFN
jgi:hypothetical protein